MAARGRWTGAVGGILLAISLLPGAEAPRPFAILILDEQTGRGVPLVELRTVHGVRLVTDSAGLAAFDEPGLMDQRVYFHLSSHGYEFSRDGFGFRGKALKVVPGGSAKLTIRRINLAERLYRVTGAGIYRDSVILGRRAPIREALLNGRVLGADTVFNAVHRGKLYWFWGDTNRPDYPLGNYDASGATSALPGKGGLDPEAGIDLTYFVDETRFARPMARMPGDGPTWITSLLTLPDARGSEKLYASYVKVKPPLTLYGRGLAVFDDDKQSFSHLQTLDFNALVYPEGHTFRHMDSGTEYVYFANPYPLTRVKANAEDFQQLKRYETFTCLKEGSRLDRPDFDRDDAGRLRYGWKKNTPAVGPAAQAKLLSTGQLKPGEVLLQLRDRDTGNLVRAHTGSVYWNAYRRRWVLIAVQIGGSSYLGEVWYAEGDTPLGPWAYAVKVATHERYTFYNPTQHPMFDKDGGRVIFFEGTYTNTFSGNPDATPRYEYNQVLYKLDLADPRLSLPAAVYDLSGVKSAPPVGTIHAPGAKADRPIAFFALDRPAPGTVPILAPARGDDTAALRVGKPPADSAPSGSEALFHALPADAKETPATESLYEYAPVKGGRRIYSTVANLRKAGFERKPRPLCRVWRNPFGR